MIGTEISHYRILEKLGHGGMGEVYLAEDVALKRQVALKVLPAEMAEHPERLERFRREAQTLASLDHPAIVTIHSVEEADGVHFLTMQLVKGRTLDEMIPTGGMRLPQLFDIALPLSDALAAAHEKGITHRDLKPTNVMVTDEGQVKVLDFGLAKLAADGGGDASPSATTLTGEGQVVGTVPYMSPEQVSGQDVDQRSDIFSLGVVLYEMAAGERPFSGDTSAHLISSILRDRPDPVTSFQAELPHHLGRIIHRCLEKEPRKRYQAALDVHNELDGLQQEVESGVLRTSSATIPAAQPVEKKRSWLIGAVAVVVIGAATVFWLRGPEPETSTTAAEPPASFQQMELTQLTTSGKALEAAISPDGRYVAHLENDAGMSTLHVLQVTTGSRVEIIPPTDVTTWDPVFSPDGEYIYIVMTETRDSARLDLYRLPVLGGPLQKVLEGVDQRISFSPTGDRFAFMRDDPETGAAGLYIANSDGSGEQLLKSSEPPERFYQDPSWSPSGNLVAVPWQMMSPEVRIRIVGVDVASGDSQPLTDTQWFNVGELAWYPDGSGLVMTAVHEGFFGSGQIWEVAHPSGTARRVTNDLNNYTGVSLTEDGDSLVTVLFETVANVWTVGGDGAAVQKTTGRERNGQLGVAAAPDGTLLYTSSSGRLLRLSPDGSVPRSLSQGDTVQVGPVVSPDGRYVAYTSDEGGGINVFRRNLDGSDPVQLTRGSADYSPAFSPDSQWVLYLSNDRLHRVAVDGGEPVQLSERRIRTRPVASPDGDRIALSTYYPDRERWLLDIVPFDGGEPLQTLELPQHGELRWAPDGTALVYSSADSDVQNLWRVPLDGTTPEQITTFDAEYIWSFDLLPDGGFVLARGTYTSDVVLLENFR